MPKNKVSKLKDGRWYYAVTSGNGERLRLTSRKGESKRDFNKRCDLLDQQAEGLAPGMTLDQLHHHWMLEYATTHLSDADRLNMDTVFRLHVSPYIGSQKIDAISKADVYRVLSRMDKNNLSATYIRKARCSISRIYAWAINSLDIDIISPTQGLIYRPTTSGQAPIRVISEDELTRFYEAAKNTKYEYYYRLLSATGLRPSEALGLQVEDDQGDYLQIRRGITIHGLSDLKTTKSRREIPITNNLRNILDVAKHGSSNGWLFATERGTPNMSAVNSSFKRTKKQTEVWERGGRNGQKKIALLRPAVDFSLYDFRHTFATRMAEAGMPETALTAIMGHESIQTTLQYYVGLTDEMMDKARDILESLD